MKKFYLPFLFLFMLRIGMIAQTPGALDATFNTADVGNDMGSSANNAVFCTALQANGQVLIGGGYTTWNGATNRRISRLNADGTLDNTFNFPLSASTGPNSAVNAVEVQPDGKILIAGAFTSFSGVTTRYVARLLPNGTKDVSFDPGTSTSTAVTNMILQPDGKVILGGNFTSFNGTARNRVARVNADGSLDLTFDPGSGANNSVSALALQSDGKILVGGNFGSFNGLPNFRIARLNTDGTVDGTFSTGTGANYIIRTIAVQPDGKILLGGDLTSYAGNSYSRIVRILPSGAIDTTFAIGSGFDNRVSAITVQPDGKVLVGGIFSSYNGTPVNRVVRLNANGTIDNTFVIDSGADDEVRAFLVQPNSRILIAGYFTKLAGTQRNRFARLMPDFAIDTTFNGGTGADNIVRKVVAQPDGKVLAAGDFTMMNARVRHSIARLLYNGSSDPAFFPGKGADSAIYALSLQSDNKIIAGGGFAHFDQYPRNSLVRLLPNGRVDTTYQTGTGANGKIYATGVQSDGKILAAGNFAQYNGNSSPGIVRTLANGSHDGTFSVGTGITGTVYALVIQTDGKVVLGGSFTQYNGVPTGNIVRLNTDGSLDAAFLAGTGFDNTVWTLALQSDGKIIAGGDFTTYNAASKTRVARLNTDGTLDAAYNSAAGPNNSVRNINLQADGKAVLVGDFTTVNGTGRVRAARLLTDGTLDAAFLPGTGPAAIVYACDVQPTGKVAIGGAFLTVAGTGRNRIARLNGECIAPILLNPVNDTRCDSGQVFLSAAASGGAVEWFTQPTGGTLVFTGTDFSPSIGTSTTYYAQANDGTCGISARTAITGTVNNSISVSQSLTLCAGQSITVGGSTYNATGTYTDVFTRTNGCDSTLTTNLTVLAPIASSQSFTLCAGQSVTVNGNNYDTTGVYTDILTATNGCDSTVTTNLTVNAAIATVQNLAICNGQSITVGSNTYSTTGTYVDVLTANNSCDSTVTTHLLVTSPSTVSQSLTICQGQSITVGPSTYSTAGNYVDTLVNVGGCDSVVNTALTVNQPSNFNQTFTLCAGESVNVGGNIHDSTGIYTDILVANNGCDSTVTTNLTVLALNLTQQQVAICDGDSVVVGTSTYFSSGNYSDTLMAANSCDSIVNTALTVAPAVDVSTTQLGGTVFANNTTANSYQWLDCENFMVPISGATTSSYAPAQTGSYAVAITVGSCTDTSACVEMIVVGISKMEDSGIRLYPNPASGGNFSIDWAGLPVESVEVMNALGQVQYAAAVPKGTERISVALPGLAGGIYGVRVKAGEAVYWLRVIIE